MDKHNLKNILVIRTDRIGDVLLSTPVLTALKRSFPGAKVSMLVRAYTEEIVRDHPDVDEILLFDEKHEIHRFSDLWHWSQKLRKLNFDAALMLYPTFNLALITFMARIPIRVGTGYRAYSFLFNERVYHHRKTAARHELEYNLELAEKIGASLETVEFKFHIPQKTETDIDNYLRKHGIKRNEKFVVIHPGSGGSALDWPLKKFAELNDRLQNELNVKVIMTGGSGEEQIVGAAAQQTKFKPIEIVGQLNLKELGALLEKASLFIGNSTGPLHLAVAVGTPVVAFYPPITPCLPARWGPYGHLDSVLMPPVKVCQKCTKQQCPRFNCMELIEVESAFHRVRQKLGISRVV